MEKIGQSLIASKLLISKFALKFYELLISLIKVIMN